MSRWRVAVLLVLFVLPLVFLIGFGSYRLWQLGLMVYVWWPLSACVALGYFLGWYWLRQKQLIAPIDFSAPLEWTQRDRDAWKLVELRAKQVAEETTTEFKEVQYYSQLAQDMALELARFYHPKASDPIGSLTVPEILAVVELASHDLSEMVKASVPGGHLMTINQWRWAKQTADKAQIWYRNTSNIWWLASALMSPIDTGVRYAASQLGMTRPWQMFQQNLIVWFHMAFVHRLGTYLIDLNSGRLRVGAHRYQELRRQYEGAPAEPTAAAAPVQELQQVAITVMGQVKMGKSSFVNALLGEQRAKADVLPATEAVTRYELQHPDIAAKLVVLDTVGYAHTGARADQVQATRNAAQQSDVLVLVLHARSPARQADVDMLTSLRTWFAGRLDLKMPPVLAVVTHVDLLSPALEWAPPYDWQVPKRTKEVQIAEALAAVREQFGSDLVGAVPVCVAEGRVYGLNEFFLPALLDQIGEAKGVALLRTLRNEADAGKVRQVVEQCLNVGAQLLKVWAESRARR